jgi:hypothetical protein
MRTSRAIRPAVFRTAAAFVITTALAAGPLAAAAPAFAADATVASVATADDGTLSVELPDASALWVKVSVRASADPDLAPVWTSDELSYGGGQGWHTDKPVSLPAELAYGDYPVDVDYRLPGGTVQHWSGAEHGTSGLLSYRLHTGVASVAYDREYTDFDHRSPVVSGTVTSYDPVTGTTSPARAGTTVKVNWSASVGVDQKSGTATAVSDDTGAFQVAVTPGGSITSGSATVVEPAADTDPDVSTGLPALPAHTTTYRISADGNHASVHKGKTFTVKGSVLKLTDDGWKPFADAPLVTTPQPPDSYRYTTPGLMGTGTSTATGTFSYPVTATKTTYYYSYVQPSAYLSTLPYAENYITVPTAGSFKDVKLTVDAYRQVTAKGKLLGSCGTAALTLQYSKNGSSGWKTIGSGKAGDQYSSGCSFSLKGYGSTDGYYRVRHAESDRMLEAISAKKRLNRVETRIIGFDMTPNSPAVNGKLTAKGTLQYKSGGKWKAYKGGKIVVVFRPKGDSNWYWTVKGTTDSKGHFSLRTKAYQDGTWATYLAADAKHFYSESKTEYVNAR